MMQHVTCNKYFLFASRLKTLKDQGISFFNVIELRDINAFYMELRSSWTILQCNLNWIEFQFKDWISLLKTNGMQIGG
jgi:hypothetical protein